jgi:hypothetical protein
MKCLPPYREEDLLEESERAGELVDVVGVDAWQRQLHCLPEYARGRGEGDAGGS